MMEAYCEHGTRRFCDQGCKTADDYRRNNEEAVDSAAARFRRERSGFDAVGINAWDKAEADEMLAYAKRAHPDVPFVIQSLTC